MMLVLAFSLTYTAMTALCLAMSRHYRQVWSRPPKAGLSAGLRLGGGTGLLLALAACIEGKGWAIGSMIWFGDVSVAGLALVFMLPYAPRVATGLALVGPMLPLLLLLIR